MRWPSTSRGATEDKDSINSTPEDMRFASTSAAFSGLGALVFALWAGLGGSKFCSYFKNTYYVGGWGTWFIGASPPGAGHCGQQGIEGGHLERAPRRQGRDRSCGAPGAAYSFPR